MNACRTYTHTYKQSESQKPNATKWKPMLWAEMITDWIFFSPSSVNFSGDFNSNDLISVFKVYASRSCKF